MTKTTPCLAKACANVREHNQMPQTNRPAFLQMFTHNHGIYSNRHFSIVLFLASSDAGFIMEGLCMVAQNCHSLK